jgi:hypothetical protein
VAANGGRGPQALGGAPVNVIEQTTPAADTPVAKREESDQPNVIPPWVVQGAVQPDWGICQAANGRRPEAPAASAKVAPSRVRSKQRPSERSEFQRAK